MKNLYAIRDRIAEELVGRAMYLLLCFRTDQEAARYFADAINDETSILHKHPSDYELLKLGTVNEHGYIKPHAEPSIVITGDALVALQAEQHKLKVEA